MADNGQRNGAGRLVANLRASAMQDVDDEPQRGFRWEIWFLGAALCGLAYAGAMRYAAADVSALKHRALGIVAAATGGRLVAPSCLGCAGAVEPPAPMPTPTSAAALEHVAVAKPPPLSEPFELDRDGGCFALGVAALERRAPGSEPNFRSARIAAIEPGGFSVPAMRATYDDMLACVIGKAGPRLCDSDTRESLIIEVAAWAAKLRRTAAAPPPQQAPAPVRKRGRKGGEAQTRESAPAPVEASVPTSKTVAAALGREADAGRLIQADFSAAAGFLARLPDLDAALAGHVSRTGCGAS